MLEIKTNQFATRKPVNIDGHEYIVRKPGAGEQLILQQKMRRVKELDRLQKANSLSEEQEVELENLGADMLDLTASLFDDGGDGSKSKELVRSLSDEEVTLLLTKVFNEDGPATAPEKPSTKVE